VTASVATPWLASRLAGPPRAAPVLAHGPLAVYLDDGGVAVGVLAGPAVAVPVGLRTRLDRLPPVGGRAVAATIGEGAIRLGEHRFAVARVTSMAVPRLPGLRASAAAVRAVPDWQRPGSDPRLDGVLAQLRPGALDLLAAAEPAAVTELLGRGDGLTPVGDDVLAGWLVTRHAAKRGGAAVATAVARSRTRTTTLSATLLDRAAAGETLPQLRDLLVGLGEGATSDRVRLLRDDLIAVGHSSGAGLAVGVALALAPVRAGVRA
jgi:hypothetical protein